MAAQLVDEARAEHAWRPRRYVRTTRGRLLAGVCAGLAAHLHVAVIWVRLAFVVLSFSGAGVLIYAALWVLAPLSSEEAAPWEEARPPGYLLSLAALGLAGVLFLDIVGVGPPGSVAWPTLVVGLGVIILWRQADDSQRSRWRAVTGPTRAAALLRAGVGLVLVIGGLSAFLIRSDSTSGLGELLTSALVVVAGLALISGPWWVRTARELSAERSARIREQERAEIAAHVHDSVLHTLALIQRHVDDPAAVTRLARAQERELRTWLYRPSAGPVTTFAAAVEAVAAEVEDAHGIAVDVVVVGERTLDDRTRALLAATREALVNAAKYAEGSPVSVYAEVEAREVTVFVRDRGPGFVLEEVPEDRHGVRDSILARMRRHGGTAAVRTAPGEGTEVHLAVPVPADEGSQS